MPKCLYIFVQNRLWVEFRQKIGPFRAQNAPGYISFITVHAKWEQFVPNFFKNLKQNSAIKTQIQFKDPKFNLLSLPNYTILQNNKIFCSSSISHLLIDLSLCHPDIYVAPTPANKIIGVTTKPLVGKISFGQVPFDPKSYNIQTLTRLHYKVRPGNTKGEVSLCHWPPVWLVWISLFCK